MKYWCSKYYKWIYDTSKACQELKTCKSSCRFDKWKEEDIPLNIMDEMFQWQYSFPSDKILENYGWLISPTVSWAVEHCSEEKWDRTKRTYALPEHLRAEMWNDLILLQEQERLVEEYKKKDAKLWEKTLKRYEKKAKTWEHQKQ